MNVLASKVTPFEGDGQQLDGGVIDDYGKGSYGIAPNKDAFTWAFTGFSD